MSLRLRKEREDDVESGDFSGTDNTANLLAKVTQLQQRNRELEKSLAAAQSQILSKKASPKDEIKTEHSRLRFSSLLNELIDRGSWLVGLLVLQSCSSYILARYESLLANHHALIYFLTMLVGAGGNAGNQSCVKMIRELAIGKMNPSRRNTLLLREIEAGVLLSLLLGLSGLLRSLISSHTTHIETLVITVALVIIVFVSIAIGAALPFIFYYCGLDPAHSSTTIQVFMDISGVLLLCLVATVML